MLNTAHSRHFFHLWKGLQENSKHSSRDFQSVIQIKHETFCKFTKKIYTCLEFSVSFRRGARSDAWQTLENALLHLFNIFEFENLWCLLLNLVER